MKKDRPKRKKRWGWLIPVGVLGLLIVFALGMLIVDTPNRREIAEMEIGQIDFSSLNDGTYTGSYIGTKGHMRDVTLTVTVENGVITDISIPGEALDKEGNPAELGEGVTAIGYLTRAAAAQSLGIDAVSGATLTSKTLLKALENALEQAQ
ncbi:hypothetical protein SDC9_74242 [bioreactor metagenome]|uniref:FMN-binding domain-containing protein n=1 Tax=bioreactor metagenome TaxID=1076179 RepID=A0A644YHD1_9ZZZZ